MVQLIKKGGLRERANRSRSYVGSENTEKTLNPNMYREHQRQGEKELEQLSKPCNLDDQPNAQQKKHD